MGYGESEQPADDREHGSMLGMFFLLVTQFNPWGKPRLTSPSDDAPSSEIRSLNAYLSEKLEDNFVGLIGIHALQISLRSRVCLQ